jgi:hypothetical protein
MERSAIAALRCTSEEALHRVRDTRELAPFGLRGLRAKRNFLKPINLIPPVQSCLQK